MLSVGSSNEGRRRSGLGFEERGGERRRVMEVNELEEGEAYSGQEDDIDPDALSYIDEKLQHVLGHFQKEFEGGVSAETLGAKFGGYGSFLPTYQRSPPILLPQPKSPVKVPVHSLLRSPCNLQPEISCQNASVLANASIPKANNASVAQPTDKSGQRDTCISSCSMEGIMQLESTRQTMDGRDPKPLKVRIKVGPDSVLIRNKPEIYSDLGLDVSPSPSLEDSPGGSRELSPESPDSFCESPSTILQIMTCFPVPGGYLLSPLSATPLHLFEKEGISIKNFKKSMPHKVVSENCSASSDTSLRAKDVRDFTCKEKKSREKGRKLVQAHGVTCEDVITMPLNNEIGSKTPAVQKFVLSAQDMALSFSAQSVDAKDETYVGGDSIKKCSKMFDIHNEPNKILMMEGVNALDLRKDNHLELTDNMRIDDNSDKETSPLKIKAYSKTHFTEKALEGANGKFDICSKYKSKSQKNLDKKKAGSGKHRMRKDYTASFEEHVREQPAQKTCSSEKNVFKLVQARDQTFEDGGIDIKGSQNNGTLLVEPNKEKPSTVLSVAPKGIKKMSHVKDAHLENKSKLSKLQKDLNKGHNTESQSELLISVQAQRVENMRHVLGSSRSTEKSKERSEVNKVEHFRNTEPANDAPAPMNDAVPNNNSVSASPGLVLIEDNWVCCDICQRWRLLPYGTNPETLPKKWQCSMQVWLPGLNNCNVSQDETTKTFHELFQFPAPGSEPNLTAHLNAAASSRTSADTLNPGRRLENVMHNVPLSGKKKHGSLDATDLPNDSALTHLANYSKNFLASSGHKDFNDAGYCMGMDSLIKPKPGLTGRSMDIAAEKHIHKQKDKHKTASSLKVGGDLTERLAKYSKPTSKRGTDVDGHRTSKKLKKDGSYHSTKDLPSHIDLSDKMAVDGDIEYLAKVSRNTLQNCSNHSYSNDLKSKNASSRKSREQVNSSNGKHKEISSASDAEKFDKYDSNDRKRKLKERQVSQACQEISMSSEQVTGSRPMLKESLIESELRRQKKAKVAKSEGKAFRADVGGGNFEMKDCSTRIALSSNRNHPPNIIDNEGVRPATDEKIVHYQGNATSGQTLDFIDSLKRDVTYMRSLAEATSSSSKISGSQKGKVNLPEARGSPVESVSSSPMRILNNDNNSVRRNSSIKDNVISMAYSGMGSPKRFSDGELDGSSDQSGTRVKDPASNDCLISSEIYRSADSGVLDSLKGSHDYQDTETNCLTGVKSIDVKYSKTVKREDVISTDPGKSKILCGNGNVPHQPEKYHLERSDNNHTFDEDERCTLGQKNSAKCSLHPKDKRRNSNFDSDKGKIKVIVSSTDKDSHSVRTCNTSHTDADFNHLNSSKKDDLESHSKQHKNHDLRDAVVGVSRSKPAPQQNLQKASSHERQNPSGLLISESTDRSTVVFGKGTQSCNTAMDKVEKKVCGSQTALESIKGTNLEQYSVDAVNSEASKSTKPSRKFDEQNGALPNLLRQSTTSVPRSSSPMKKDGHPSVNALIKEARDLKHTANRLKSVGLEDESSGIFFESSLKFLHAASLLEPANAENARQGELVPSNQMILMYYETAKFCEFCAHEFERLKEMVAAALAYKCAEVAYLKVAYYKHPSASKDRLELQVALDAPLPGESPSSSASDIDNLNNQVGLDKVTSARAVSSPQIAGNHAIASRNRPHVMRLLTYTNYLNCAFEATKKSQNAIAAASTDLGKNGIDVRSASKVLDFNFHNVEGLLRLVRLSMNSIGH